MNKLKEFFKNIDLSKILSNFRSEYNLDKLKELTDNYTEVSEKIKIISKYLYLKEVSDKGKSSEFNELEKEVLIQEGQYELSVNNNENIRKIISNEYKVTSDNLIKYCKIIGSYVEDINKINTSIKKTIIHSNNNNNIQYDRLVEILKNASENLFDEVSKASKIIKKEQLVPNIFNEKTV
jgi:hypothetical protein